MHNDLLVGIALIAFLGISTQLVALRMGFPSIMLLLAIGILAGPVTHLIDVDHLLGDLLFPIVSLSVAIILFEGGLGLRLSDLRNGGGVIRNLILLGVPITWLLTSMAAYLLLGLGLEISLMLGAILVVTGPTVIIPLLQQIRPAQRVGSILRWEGIVIDPVGAVLAVMVFEQILATGTGGGLTIFLGTLLRTVVIGFGGGWLFAQIIVQLFSRYIVPYSLQNPTILMIIITAFTMSNLLQAESGLVTVTVMGIVLANQNRVDLHHVVEFKENLQILLISSLFILLAARLDPSVFRVAIRWKTEFFLIILILVVRPASVWISSIGSELTWKEKLFIAWMAPRGIVAAAVSSLFALELFNHGYENANLLVAYTFIVILATVTFYSLTSGWLAQILNLVQRHPQGVLFLGAQSWAQNIAIELQKLGFRVIMADSNMRHIQEANENNLETYYGNILSEVAIDDIDLGGIGRILAMTSNHEVNSLASVRFKSIFGEDEVYQLVNNDTDENISQTLSGRHLFGKHVTYQFLNERFHEGAKLEVIDIKDTTQARERIAEGLTPLFIVSKSHQLSIWTLDTPPEMQSGMRIVALM